MFRFNHHHQGAYYLSSLKLKVKVKESRNRPGVAQRVSGALGSQIA
jgi:hypothetical protein